MADTERANSLTGKAESDVPAGRSKLAQSDLPTGRSNSAPVSSADRLSASLRYYLAKRRLTQEQLAQRLGWDQPRIANIIRQRHPVTIETLDSLSKALHISSYRLLMPIREK